MKRNTVNKEINKMNLYRFLRVILFCFTLIIASLEFIHLLLSVFLPRLGNIYSIFLDKLYFIGKILFCIPEFVWPYVSWLLYNICVLFVIYYVIAKTNLQVYWKILIVSFLLIFCFIIIVPFINMINICLLIYSNNGPFIEQERIDQYYPKLSNIKLAYNSMLEEYQIYTKNNKPNCFDEINPLLNKAGLSNGNPDNCWRSLFIKTSGNFVEGLKSDFPRTMNALDISYVHNAFFSILDPGVDIPEHVGYYKGYIRYHLGIDIPDCDDNCSEKAFITVGDETYHWSNGEAVVFDDMYKHYVKNPTGKKRVVLFVDVIRRDLPIVLQMLNKLGIILIEGNPILRTLSKNQHKPQKI